jgi:hypothetical protein
VAPRIVYLTPEQLCERWNHRLKPKTLANWRSQGRGPPYRRLGNRILYPLPEVEAFEQRQQFTSTDAYGPRGKPK